MGKNLRETVLEKAAELQAPTVAQDDDEDAAELEQLGQQLVSAARDRRKRTAVMDKIEVLLTGLSDSDMKALADHPVVAKFLDVKAKAAPKAGDPPGTIYQFRGIPFAKKAWTEADLKASDIPIVEFELEDPVDYVGWNGLRRSYGVGVHRDYACFVDQIKRHRRNELRFAAEHQRALMGQGPITHPDMADPTTMRVMATATGGGEFVNSASMDAIPVVAVEAEGGKS